MLDQLSMFLTFPFVQHALIAGTLIALSSSLLGVTLVLKRYSFMGDSLSHMVFFTAILAGILRVNNTMLVVMPLTILCAVFLLCRRYTASAQSEAMLAMVSVASLALGYLFINVFSDTGNVATDVCTTLFGSTSILTLKRADVWMCVAMSLVVVGVFAACYHTIFAVTFDEEFCRAAGVNTQGYSVLIAVITAVIIVLSMELVGSLLTSALIIFPALSALKVFRGFRAVVIGSAVISVACAVLGILASILYSTPVGSTIVAAECIVFAVFSVVGLVRK